MSKVFQKFHRASYPAIDATSPANSQAGKTILITGGSLGVGRATAKAFIAASADRVIIASRGAENLAKTLSQLEEHKPADSETIVLTRQLDLSDSASIPQFWADLKKDGIAVDVLVLNAAKGNTARFSDGWQEAWSYFEVNVLGNLRMTEEFLAQGPEKGKKLINLSTCSAHFNPVPTMEVYATSKASFTHLLQMLADEVPAERCQIVSFHPGRIRTEGAINAGFGDHPVPWDNETLPAHWAVWASTAQAAFLHGRFVWAHWDVEELAGMKEKFSDHGFLKLSLQGYPLQPSEYFAMI